MVCIAGDWVHSYEDSRRCGIIAPTLRVAGSTLSQNNPAHSIGPTHSITSSHIAQVISKVGHLGHPQKVLFHAQDYKFLSLYHCLEQCPSGVALLQSLPGPGHCPGSLLPFLQCSGQCPCLLLPSLVLLLRQFCCVRAKRCWEHVARTLPLVTAAAGGPWSESAWQSRNPGKPLHPKLTAGSAGNTAWFTCGPAL